MYIPGDNQFTKQADVLDFIRQFNFASLLSLHEQKIVATHLPFISTIDEAGNLVLNAHMAKANTQWLSLVGQEVLVIFQEPHAYISPSLYEKQHNVPTWNYVSVHLYGQTKIINEKPAVLRQLEKLMLFHEADYLHQWQTLPEEYINALLEELVMFEIQVNKIEAKQKLSQNKSMQEQLNIIEHLKQQSSSAEKYVAEFMEKRLKH